MVISCLTYTHRNQLQNATESEQLITHQRSHNFELYFLIFKWKCHEKSLISDLI